MTLTAGLFWLFSRFVTFYISALEILLLTYLLRVHEPTLMHGTVIKNNWIYEEVTTKY